MSVDYDLIIWGGSPAGTEAAVMAAQRRARVGLILPTESGDRQIQYPHFLTLPQGLHHRSPSSIRDRDSPPLSYRDLSEWVRTGVETFETLRSPSALAALGIDTIEEEGTFYLKGGQPVIDLSSRRLAASAYLLAPETQPRVDIEGLESTRYLTPATLTSLETLPSSLAIIGSDPCGIELAQLFQELGSQVTLVVEQSRILPAEEPEASQGIQVQLEGLGVEILTNTQVSQARWIDGQTWLQVGNRAIAVDNVLFVTPPQPPWSQERLDALGIQWSDRGLIVNRKLQTTHPQIYACGELIGGYSFPHLGIHEAKTVVKNALIAPVFNIDYQALPYTIYSRPTLSRVGLTEAGARQRYGSSIQVIAEEMKRSCGAILLGEIAGLIKVIVRPNGIILGATIVGARSPELIYPLSLAIRHQIKLQEFYPTASFGSLSEGLTQVRDRWHTRRFERSQWAQLLLKWWLSWKRG